MDEKNARAIAPLEHAGAYLAINLGLMVWFLLAAGTFYVIVRDQRFRCRDACVACTPVETWLARFYAPVRPPARRVHLPRRPRHAPAGGIPDLGTRKPAMDGLLLVTCGKTSTQPAKTSRTNKANPARWDASDRQRRFHDSIRSCFGRRFSRGSRVPTNGRSAF